MTSPLQKTPQSSRVPRVLATVLGGILTILVVNSLSGGGSDPQQLTTASLFGVPGASDDTPAAIATTAPVIEQTAPLQVPTATPAPTSTAVPTATALPTAVPTATPIPPEPPTAVPLVAATTTDSTAQAAVPEPAPPTASVDIAPTATPVTVVQPPEPTATVEVVVSVEPTAEITAEPTVAVEPTATATPEPTATPVPQMTIADLENYVLGEINAVRAKAGLGPLALDPAVSDIARNWSGQMASGGFFSHRPPDQLGAMLPAGWRQWGENIASAPDIYWAQSSLENSPGHYANMVGSFTHVGIGVHRASGQVWVTQNFVRY